MIDETTEIGAVIEQGLSPKVEINSVAIFGSADLEQSDAVCVAAGEAARRLAERGYTIVNGGGPGVMQAATAGAEAVGGKTLTVTYAPENAPHFEGTASDNQADETLQAKTYVERIGMLIAKADAFVVFKGGTGTISEWGLIWLLAHIYYGQHKPFILYGDFWFEVVGMVQKHFLIEEVEMNVFRIVNSTEEMLSALDELQSAKQELQDNPPSEMPEPAL